MALSDLDVNDYYCFAKWFLPIYGCIALLDTLSSTSDALDNPSFWLAVALKWAILVVLTIGYLMARSALKNQNLHQMRDSHDLFMMCMFVRAIVEIIMLLNPVYSARWVETAYTPKIYIGVAVFAIICELITGISSLVCNRRSSKQAISA